ncbi:MAG: inner membrane CreD family protein, partial [Chitinophagales bacterium]|nr:inner membrane CreD family protein [Chitinophagales bacterium]
MNNNSSFIDRLNKWLRESITVKLFVIGILILILLIPARMVEDLIIERESLRDTAIADISSKWGGMQLIGGPVLTVPYTISIKNERNEIENIIQYAHFLPKTLNIKGQLFPEKRYRGIYVVVLYNAKLKLEG